MSDLPAVEVELLDLPPLPTLAHDWRDLEARSDGSFFNSWSWIGAWLEGLPAGLGPRLLRARAQGRVVGLGVVVFRRIRRHRVLVAHAAFLNATGDPTLDAIAIEHNGLRIDRALVDAVEPAMYAALLAHPGWEELYLPALSAPPRLPPDPPRGVGILHEQPPSFVVDLERVRAQRLDYVALLSANTRSALRRSQKAYRGLGPIAIRAAADLAEARRMFEAMKVLHQQNWQARGQPGAFANRFLSEFHDRVIADCLPRGEVQLVEVEAGAQRVGYLYNLVHAGRVANYQSGLNFDQLPAPNAAPGLVAHAECIVLNAGLGHAYYDLLLGDYRYKRQLCLSIEPMHAVRLRRDRLKFRVEERLRAIKRRHQAARAARAAAEAPPAGATPEGRGAEA